YDFGDTAQLTPLVAMHTLGHDFVPPGIPAGGLRYHGVAPIVSQLLLDDLIRAEAYTQTDCFGSAVKFARAEGIIPAPESSHAIHGAIQAAKRADESGTSQVILFNLSGHGHFDMAAYEAYLHGNLEEYELPEEAIEAVISATNPMPATITPIPITRPAVVCGVTSPYPTVVIVDIAHQTPSHAVRCWVLSTSLNPTPPARMTSSVRIAASRTPAGVSRRRKIWKARRSRSRRRSRTI